MGLSHKGAAAVGPRLQAPSNPRATWGRSWGEWEEAAAPASASALWSQSFGGGEEGAALLSSGPEEWGGPPAWLGPPHSISFLETHMTAVLRPDV